MARREVSEILWLLKWAGILALIGAISAVILFVQWHIKWQIASPIYYFNFFKELIINPQYAEGLKQIKLAAITGALIGGLGPVVFILKK